MKNDELSVIAELYVNPDQIFSGDYLELSEGSALDIGFVSETRDGRDVHKVTRGITLSVQQFHRGQLTNLVFSDGKAIRIQLSDTAIIPYYSDYIEIRYIIEGTLLIDVEGERVTFEKGEFCFINSNAYHHESIRESDCTILNIGIDRNLFNEAFLTNIALSPLQKFLRTNMLRLGQSERYLKFTPLADDSAQIRSYTGCIFREVKDEKPGYLDISKGYIIRLMDSLSQGYQYHFSKSEAEIYYKNLFETVTEYMEAHLATVTAGDLSEEFHFHPNYFTNLIRKHTGLSYSAYLIRLRMNRAKELLKTGDLSVEEIAWLVGYHNKGFFYKCFREDCGMNPAAYREQFAGNGTSANAANK